MGLKQDIWQETKSWGRHHPRRNGSCLIPSGRRLQDAAQNVYMGNKFLALRKSEVAKVAPDRASPRCFCR